MHMSDLGPRHRTLWWLIVALHCLKVDNRRHTASPTRWAAQRTTVTRKKVAGILGPTTLVRSSECIHGGPVAVLHSSTNKCWWATKVKGEGILGKGDLSRLVSLHELTNMLADRQKLVGAHPTDDSPGNGSHDAENAGNA